jgi:hypothetical protein
MAKETAKLTTSSIEPSEAPHSLPETSYEQVREPGAYVDQTTGDLYRIPEEALIRGASPVVVRESRSPSHLRQVSRDPFVTTMEARLVCCRHNIEPNF